MDLELDGTIVFEDVARSRYNKFIDPHKAEDIAKMFHPIQELPALIAPGVRALLSTANVIEIPKDALGAVSLRSTWARLGLFTPPTNADPGFKGTLTMELYNASSHTFQIVPEDKLWTMHLLALVKDSEGLYDGRYQYQSGLKLPLPLTETPPEIQRTW